MNKKILLLFTLLITFSVNAQVDSLTISNLESKLIKQINQQKVGFNQELSDIKNLQDNRLKQALDKLSVLTKSQEITQLKLDSLSEKQALSNQIALGLEKQITSLESKLNDKVNLIFSKVYFFYIDRLRMESLLLYIHQYFYKLSFEF